MGMHSVLQDGFDMRSAVWAPILACIVSGCIHTLREASEKAFYVCYASEKWLSMA